MQSDTFLNDTDSDDEAYSSDSSGSQSGDQPKNNNIGVTYDFPKSSIEGERFLDQSSQEKYVKLRNELFTPELLKGRICFYTSPDGGYNSSINLVDDFKLNGLDNVIGFELISSCILSVSASVPFLDIRIPELPHICCKQNENGIPILDRVPLDLNTSTQHKYIQDRPYKNYFTPMKLSMLTLEVRLPTGVVTEAYKGFYEFEITVLNRSLSDK
tara:strand:- start:379 stop:1020 length:642 start_codon:yes stop_codon:yes gene_type:complete